MKMIESLQNALEADPGNPFLQGHVEALEPSERKLNPTNTFMIDIETGGLAPGGAILEIAASEFDPETGAVLREWEGKIDLLDSLRLGFTFDAETAGFHLRNGYAGTLRGGTLWRIINALDTFLHLHSEDVTVWAWGKDFEAKHFEHVLGIIGFPPLWDFRKLHCARDKWIEAFGDKRPAKRQHTALQDVAAQITDLCQALRALNPQPLEVAP